MRRTKSSFRLVAVLFLCGAVLSKGQDRFAPIKASDYDRLLAKRPPDLKLTLTLPKDHFYQGEIIEATLTYSNAGKNPYVVPLAPGDRSGRVQNVHFYGQDSHGIAVEDPIGWIYFEGFSGGGRVAIKNLGTAANTLIMNQWLRFDHPGAYRVFAQTTNVRPGSENSINGENSLSLVSNKVALTITPLPPGQETQIVADALHKIEAGYRREDSPQLSADQNEENAHNRAYAAEPAIATLRFLQTPGARAALRSRLDQTPEYMIAGGHFEMDAALLGAPDRPAEAALILADVRAGRLKVDGSLASLYADLKAYPLALAYFAWRRPHADGQ